MGEVRIVKHLAAVAGELPRVRPAFRADCIPIVFVATDTWAMPLGVCIQSIVAHADEFLNYDIVVVGSNIHWVKRRQLQMLQRPNVSIRFVDIPCRFSLDAVSGSCRLTCAQSLRFLLEFLFPYQDRIIYLDSDTIVLRDISKLFAENVSGYLAGAAWDLGMVYTAIKCPKLVAEFHKRFDLPVPEGYFNSGVLLLNLEEMRRQNIGQQLLTMQRTTQPLIGIDQQYYNAVFRGRVKFLDGRWNFLEMYFWENDFFKTVPLTVQKLQQSHGSDPFIIHYVGPKPWHHVHRPRGDIFWHYARQTPFCASLFPNAILCGPGLGQVKLADASCKRPSIGSICRYHACKILRRIAFFKKTRRYFAARQDALAMRLSSNFYDRAMIPAEPAPRPNIPISIVIPVYNAAVYLRQCLDSAIHQTLREIEIICVDDHSTDESLSILREYAARDPRIQVLENAHNRGTLQMRVMGVLAARGQYILCLDADDALELSIAQQAFEAAISHPNGPVDIVHFRCKMQRPDMHVPIIGGFLDCRHFDLLRQPDLLEHVASGAIAHTLWGKIIQRKCYIAALRRLVGIHNILQRHILHPEDFVQFMAIAFVAKSYLGINVPGYYYLQRSSSINMKIRQCGEAWLKCMDDTIATMSAISTLFKNCPMRVRANLQRLTIGIAKTHLRMANNCSQSMQSSVHFAVRRLMGQGKKDLFHRIKLD
ncbi:MAG: glycosyltransferase [Puniceicoccales bacterium]|jgi:lipopolysaccharide biosynthesis glycosyltransferase/glycosyltransferase involved in cell wall biosynthesis|nr:glycosyltransferase [Puniceicoccales bacterium]